MKKLKLFQECGVRDIFYLQLIGSTLNNRNRKQEVAECSRKGMGILSVTKHRNGSTGRIYYSYNPSMSHITAFKPSTFSGVNATTAKQHLHRWIAYCKPLSDELRSIGYNPAKHSFSRNEVKVIVKHLGEP